MIKTFEELKDCQNECRKAFDAKIKGEDGKRAIVLCGGTGCLSSNSEEIRKKFEVLVFEHDLSKKVTVINRFVFGRSASLWVVFSFLKFVFVP